MKIESRWDTKIIWGPNVNGYNLNEKLYPTNYFFRIKTKNTTSKWIISRCEIIRNFNFENGYCKNELNELQWKWICDVETWLV